MHIKAFPAFKELQGRGRKIKDRLKTPRQGFKIVLFTAMVFR